jgi:O-antigen/teichoic acid export membrane protein
MTLYQSGKLAGQPDQLVRELRWKTVYSGASAAHPRNRIMRMVRRDGDLLTNSGSLMGSTIITAAMGFVYWWVAARAFSADAVGTASAAVSAMTLIGTLAMFGLGTMLISELPRMERDQWSLITTCLLVAGAIATVGALIYIGLAELVFHSLRDALGSPLMMVLVLVGIVFNAMTMVLDEGLVGLLAGPTQMMRNLYFAVAKLTFLIVLGLLPVGIGGDGILATWLGGIVLSVGLLAITLHRRGVRASIRPKWTLIGGRIRQAFDYNLLNLASSLPRTMLPLVVTSALTKRATGEFYIAYMVFTFAVMIPANLATTLFAVAAGDMVTLKVKVRTALLVSLGLGVPASLVMAFGSHQIMAVFGGGYERTASTALTILALTYIPAVFRQLYIAVCRVRRRVRQAAAMAVVAGVFEVGAAWYGGTKGSLTTLSLWLGVVFVLEGFYTAPAVLRIVFSHPKPALVEEPESTSAPAVAEPEVEVTGLRAPVFVPPVLAPFGADLIGAGAGTGPAEIGWFTSANGLDSTATSIMYGLTGKLDPAYEATGDLRGSHAADPVYVPAQPVDAVPRTAAGTVYRATAAVPTASRAEPGEVSPLAASLATAGLSQTASGQPGPTNGGPANGGPANGGPAEGSSGNGHPAADDDNTGPVVPRQPPVHPDMSEAMTAEIRGLASALRRSPHDPDA